MDLFTEYFDYVGSSESPSIYHRWSCISMIGALVGRQCWLPFGHSPMYPTQYILLVGSPGARKSGAIKVAKVLMEKAGYKTFARDRTSPERFFHDMVPVVDEYDPALLDITNDEPSEVYIANGEFLDFIGRGNMDFLTVLTNLWDNLPYYDHPKLHGKSVYVIKPTINILGGATVKGFGMAIPQEAMGTGILSRILLIHSEPSNVKISFPRDIPEDAADNIVESMLKIKADCKGRIERTKGAEKVADRIYHEFKGLGDNRLEDYSARRYTHLLKIAIARTLSRGAMILEAEDILAANTMLANVEYRMPRVFGEFGSSPTKSVANTVVETLAAADRPLGVQELFPALFNDVRNLGELQEVLTNLKLAKLIESTSIGGSVGYVGRKAIYKEWHKDLVLEGYLQRDEIIT